MTSQLHESYVQQNVLHKMYAQMTHPWSDGIALGSHVRVTVPPSLRFDWGTPENEATARCGALVIGRSDDGTYELACADEMNCCVLQIDAAWVAHAEMKDDERERLLVRFAAKLALKRYGNLFRVVDTHLHSEDCLPGTLVAHNDKVGLVTFAAEDAVLVLWATPVAHFRHQRPRALHRVTAAAWRECGEETRQFLLRAYGVVTWRFERAYARHVGSAYPLAPFAPLALPSDNKNE